MSIRDEVNGDIPQYWTSFQDSWSDFGTRSTIRGKPNAGKPLPAIGSKVILYDDSDGWIALDVLATVIEHSDTVSGKNDVFSVKWDTEIRMWNEDGTPGSW